MAETRRCDSSKLLTAFWIATVLLTLSWLPSLAQHDSGKRSHWKGQEAFRSKGCAQCHAVWGSGGSGGPDLGKRKFYGTYLELAARMWNHFPKMYGKMQDSHVVFRSINQQEMEHLIDYLSFIRYRGEPGDWYKGRELLEDKCAKCHRFDGRGGDVGPDIVNREAYVSSLQLVESMWNHGPDMAEVFREQGVDRPEFKGNDLEDIAAAVRSYNTTAKVPPDAFLMGDPINGQKLFEEKGCIRCHSVDGAGGTLGPNFAELDLDRSAVQIAGDMWNHAPKMWKLMESENVSFPAFEAGGLADVISFLYARRLEDAPGDPEKGQRIIHDKHCLSCHSFRGEGGDVSEDLATLTGLESPLAMIAAMWNHAPGMRDKQLEKNLDWPKLQGRDMADLYAFLGGTASLLDKGK